MEIDGWFIRSPQRKVVRGWRAEEGAEEEAGGWGCSSSSSLSLFFHSPVSVSCLLTFDYINLCDVCSTLTQEDAVKSKQTERIKKQGVVLGRNVAEGGEGEGVARLRGAQMLRRATNAHSLRASSEERRLLPS